MAFEYEYRYVVVCPFEEACRIVKSCGQNVQVHTVLYAQPNFRYKNGLLETKECLSHAAVYCDGLWFKFAESLEVPFEAWTRETHQEFIRSVSFHQNPFKSELRMEVDLGSNAKIFAFQKTNLSGLVFELEVGLFEERRKQFKLNLSLLRPFRSTYTLLGDGCFPPYRLSMCRRKPVIPVKTPPTQDVLVARKHDGIFGIVSSHPDKIVESWEDNRRHVWKGDTLGDGFVYGAERISDDRVILLDVYQVRGSRVLCSRSVLTDYLSSLSTPERYRVQIYREDVESLPPPTECEDGLIFHDTVNDKVYKTKSRHTVDLMYSGGRFLFPNKDSYPSEQVLVEGAVYECEMAGDRLVPIRRRTDRTTGNTQEQLQAILECVEKI